MTATAGPSITALCPHCGGSQADPQTGRCLKCGKRAVSPDLAAEFGHPVLNRHDGEARHSPSASYRNAAPAAAEPAPAPPPLTLVPEQESESESETPPVTPETIKSATAWALAPADKTVPVVTFRLPDNPSTTKWIVETRALRDKLIAQAEKAEGQIQDLQAEAARNRESAQAFTQLLEGIAIGDAVSAPSAPPRIEQPATKPHAKWSKHADACIECHRSDVPHLATDRCRTCYDKKYAREHGRSS